MADGHLNKCKACTKLDTTQWQEKNLDQSRRIKREGMRRHAEASYNRRLERDYGITRAEYDGRLASQGGRCAICPRAPTEKQRLRVDHCHKTGKVRALLCMQCNSGLGLLGDSFDTLLTAAKYLQEHGGII